MDEETRNEIVKWLRKRSFVRETIREGCLEDKIDAILDTVDFIEKGVELVLRALFSDIEG